MTTFESNQREEGKEKIDQMTEQEVSILLPTSSSIEFWVAGGSVGGGCCWATAFVILFLLFFHLLRSRRFIPNSSGPSSCSSSTQQRLVSSTSVSTGTDNTVISDTDLKELIRELQQQQQQQQDDGDAFVWEDVINKRSPLVSYNAKCCRLNNGSLKYFSITTFENCPTELLREFYMDNEYRKKWDRIVLDHQQLQLDTLNMVEYGLTIKKFPFLTPREYVLVWRIWEGNDKSFYCLVKDCEHPLAPQRKRHVRVGSFRSGWSIQKVSSRDACQITMVHQEDAGLNVEMAKLAFAKGIWRYICKMDNALREYSSWMPIHPKPIASLACSQIPADYESSTQPVPYDDAVPDLPKTGKMGWQEKALANKWLGKGLLLVGGVVYLSRGHSSLATQLAMTCFLKKLTGQGQEKSSKEKLEESKRRNFDLPVGITG